LGEISYTDVDEAVANKNRGVSFFPNYEGK